MKQALLLLGMLILSSCNPEVQCPYADEVTYDAYGNVVECTYYQGDAISDPIYISYFSYYGETKMNGLIEYYEDKIIFYNDKGEIYSEFEAELTYRFDSPYGSIVKYFYSQNNKIIVASIYIFTTNSYGKIHVTDLNTRTTEIIEII